MTTSAAAPSFTPGALPAVTDPSFLNAGFNAFSTSTVESGLMVSSRSKTMGAPFGCGTSTGTISAVKRPSAAARAAFRWLSAA